LVSVELFISFLLGHEIILEKFVVPGENQSFIVFIFQFEMELHANTMSMCITMRARTIKILVSFQQNPLFEYKFLFFLRPFVNEKLEWLLNISDLILPADDSQIVFILRQNHR
jgi:hypothetical protein